MPKTDTRPPDSRTTKRPQRRGEERAQAQLEAAAALFVEKGFEATSLNDIIGRAGGSRTTLYTRFGDKDGLFRALMKEHCNRIQGEMVRILEENTGLSRLSLAEGLARIGLHIIRTLADPKTIAIVHTLVSEGRRIPDIAGEFQAMGQERGIQKIAEYLRAAPTGDGRRIGDADAKAEIFFSMILGSRILRQLTMPGYRVDVDAAEEYVRHSVRVFLAGCFAEG
ncbi:AcrR family transcriptional regulator [Azospirillum fermentarium]|uniref:TetR/AcrR family transcriptional regulator n=1 Tax=Azospirillum fermentarium TaxID=1233114 RepID=UPI0022270130|nr:TetR/AcrR family transcriptional regulator [Azospirillum fermentarium]MCW2246999.1 AcrR family transcriptional regulator [Azospirillum fermentarium]